MWYNLLYADVIGFLVTEMLKNPKNLTKIVTIEEENLHVL